MEKGSAISANSQAQLDKAWADAYLNAEQQFARITKKYLKGSDGMPMLQGKIRPQDLTDQVQTRKKNQDKDRESHHKWTQVLQSVLLPIDRLGGLVAGAMSVALPGSPAGFAFNALSFVVQVGHEVSTAYDTLADLFEQVSQALTRLDHHASSNDDIASDLISIVSQIFISLIVISALSIQLLKQKVVLTYIKTAFLGSDPNIAAQIKKMKQLTTSEGLMVGALTYEQVREIGNSLERLGEEIAEMKVDLEVVKEIGFSTSGDVKGILSIVERKELSSKAQEQLKRMKEIIGPQVTNTVDDIYHGMVGALTPDTGNWIQQEPLFQDWLDPDKKLPLLAILGDPGTGKSHLAARTIERLINQYPQSIQHPSRVSVTYHFCRGNVHDLQSFSKALRAMACTIALNDPNFLEFFDKEYSSSIELQSATVHQLWTKLFVDFFGKDKKSRVYLIFDALDQALASERDEFLIQLKEIPKAIALGASHRISVLLVADSSLETALRDSLGSSLQTIKVTPDRNLHDITLFVTKEIDAIKNLKADPKLKSEIIEKVPKNANGNFQLAKYTIKEIRKKGRADDVRRVLDESPADLPEAIRNDLSRLGESLEPFEIAEVNEILKWVICSPVLLTLTQLDLMLAMNPEVGGGLASLESRLRNQYKALFSVRREDGKSTEEIRSLQVAHTVKVLMAERPAVGSELANQLGRNMNADAEDPGSDVVQSDPDTTYVELANGSIQQVLEDHGNSSSGSNVGVIESTEINIVEHFLRLVCAGDMYERFGFKEFLEQKRQQKTTLINIDIPSARIETLKACLSILCEDERWEQYDSKKLKSLQEYISCWFLYYVSYLEWSLLKEPDKKEVGKQLVKCVQNEKVIKRWATEDYNVRYLWIRNKELCEKVLMMLKDDTVYADLSKEEKIWIDTLTRDNCLELSLPAVRFLATQWLKGKGEAQYSGNVQSLLDYIEYIESEKPGYKRYESSEEDEGMVPKVLEAAKWASFDEDSVWHERVGSALLEYGSEERAIKEFETAKSLDEKNWRADLGLARALAEQPGKRPRAIKMMERTLEILEADEIWMAQNEKDFSKCFFELAEWYSGNGELEKAAKGYRRVWGLSPNDPTKPAATSLIKVLFRLQKYNEITDFLRQMAEEMPYDAEVDRLTEFYHVTAMEMEFYDHIGTSGRKSGALDFLRESYQKAIKEADRKSLTITSDYLLYHYGILLLRDYGEVSQATRIFEAVLSMTAATADRDLVFYLRQDAKIRLGTTYREQAKLAGVGSPTARANIDKLTQLSGRGNESEDDVDSDAPQSGDCIQILGQWLKQEENDDAGARKIFRRRVKLAIDWLSDTDPYNDADAYEILAFALTYYGDYDNASAAFSLLGPVEPELEEVENESSKGSGDDTTPEDRDLAEANVNVGGVAVQDIIGDCEDKPKEDGSKPKEEGVDLPIATVNMHRETTNDVSKSREQNPDAELIKPQTEPNEDEDGHVESTQPTNTNGVEVGTDDKDAPEAETTDPNLALADSEAEAKWLCDGLCGRTWPVLQDVWICTTCLATGFCSTCVAEVRNKTIGFRVCDPQHMFLETPKATDLLPRGKVRFRGELVGIEEWKGWIAEAWGL